MPVNREVPLIRRDTIGGTYFLLSFECAEIARQARAGQFVMLKAGHSAEPPLRRPLSIMDVEGDSFTLFIKAVGSGTRCLTDLRVGEQGLCLGPLGKPFAPPADGAEPLLIAGGYGIAPFVLFSRELRRAGITPRAFYGGRRAQDLVLQSPFTTFGVPLTLSTEDGSLGERGLVTEALLRYLDGVSRPVALYACGPGAMLRAVARVGEERRLPAQVSLDPWMGCGIGICLSCVVRIQRAGEVGAKYRCACTDGPVFDAREVVWADAGGAVSPRAGGAR